jgi:hypothetical protein
MNIGQVTSYVGRNPAISSQLKGILCQDIASKGSWLPRASRKTRPKITLEQERKFQQE